MSEYRSNENCGDDDYNKRAWHIRTESKNKVNVTNTISSYYKINHGMDRKFSCSICSKDFGRLWNLERHIKNVHTLEK